MSVKMRLKRMGTKKRVRYRIVVTETGSPRDGRFIEEIGSYDPNHNPAVVRVDAERASHWLKVGAEPSNTVKSILKKQGITKK